MWWARTVGCSLRGGARQTGNERASTLSNRQAALTRGPRDRRGRGPRIGRGLRREHRCQRRAPGDRPIARSRDDGPPVDCQCLSDHAERPAPARRRPRRCSGPEASVPSRSDCLFAEFAAVCGRTELQPAHRRATAARGRGCDARAHEPGLPRHVICRGRARRCHRPVGRMVGRLDGRWSAPGRDPRRRGVMAVGVRRGQSSPARGTHGDPGRWAPASGRQWTAGGLPGSAPDQRGTGDPGVGAPHGTG